MYVPAPRTLDIAEPQVLVHYPGDAQGNDWQHRVLLHRVAAGRWVTADPALNLVMHDLNIDEHTVLSRNGAFPDGPGYHDAIYAHDPIRPARLRELKAQAKTQAQILADGDKPVEDLRVWVIDEPDSSAWGEQVRDEDLEDGDRFMSMQDRGLQEVNGVILACRQIAQSEVADFQW